MIKLSQKDSRWSNVKLGKTNLTVGRYGCTTTCISMLSDYYNDFRTPLYLAKYLSFTSAGLLIWGSIEKILPFKFYARIKGYNREAIDEAVSNPNKSCILQVQNSHWVVAIRRIPFTNAYIIADPWTGKLSTTWSYQNNVTGCAILISK